MGNDNPSNRDNMPYVNGAVLFALVVLAVLTFAGLYANSALGFATIPVFVFLVVLFMGWSNNRALDRGEMRRAMTASLLTAFLVMVLGDGHLLIPSGLRDYFLGVLSTIIGFYFGYRGRGSEEERFNRLVHTIKSGGEIKNEGKGRKNTNG
ncbi:hypothetical protein [Thermococcus celer]|uniref:Uncharacterized protein n=1 Tax=Thermococcus celer Vu 13 = JCM 8558 TaxID=1293037 RepID=A0A218P2L7_THECE|nr:hypothetical protein [Thermococcus celer]ASI99158.1 hypothetical protein A3L02_06075 [Thermococcus celer Vu 13 = JCM 8558]